MCLVISDSSTNKIKNILETNGSIKAKKIYLPNDGRMIKHLYRTGYPVFDQEGFVESSRQNTDITKEEKEAGLIHEGIHVYTLDTDIAKAMDSTILFNITPYMKIVCLECTCYAKDFVAASYGDRFYGEMVFHRIQIDPSNLTPEGIEKATVILQRKTVKWPEWSE